MERAVLWGGERAVLWGAAEGFFATGRVFLVMGLWSLQEGLVSLSSHCPPGHLTPDRAWEIGSWI